MQTAKTNLRALTETAVLVAIAFVLSFFKFELWWPNGGSVTPVSMLFILVIGIRRGPVWGVGGALAYSLLQMLQGGISQPPTQTAFDYVLVILLDYVIAFTVLGLSGFFSKKKNGILYAGPVCLFLRFLCHFVSGIIVWSSWVRDDVLFSLSYNGSYMGVELLLTMAAVIALMRYDKTIFTRQTV